MLNQYWIVDFNRLSKRGYSEIWVAMDNFPNGIINVLGNHANFLIARESSKSKRTNLGTVQIELLSNKMNSALKSDFLPKSQEIIFSSIIFSLG